ncbi:MAG: hypothetical protein HQ567_33740 [Candidatus Nealsonbacteria bacterium]|nr:hypothetical protein [Candidatus Nealsonbacteria bacterium]
MDQPTAGIEGVARIERVAEVFEVWPREDLPFAKFKIKVLDRGSSQFLGIPNVAIKNPVTGNREGTSGLGESVEEALQDALRYFFKELQEHPYDRPLTEDDFSWADPEDF